MPQLRFYVPEAVATRLREHARARRMSLSKYLASIVEKEALAGWPEGHFEDVIGGWVGAPLERPEQPPVDDRGLL